VLPVTRLLAAVLLAAVVVTAGGCGRVQRVPFGNVPTGSAGPSASAEPSNPDDGFPTDDPPLPTAPPSPTAPPETLALPCGGRPTASQVIAALRRDRNLLPSGLNPTVVTGPLCAGTWQYTVVAVPDHDPLQVVTRGAATSLTVVNAGTNVCISTVTGAAPSGIVAAAGCQPAG
jgi:hypothetical protein